MRVLILVSLSKFFISPFVDIFERQVVISIVDIHCFLFQYFTSIILGHLSNECIDQKKTSFFWNYFCICWLFKFFGCDGFRVMKIFVIVFSSFMTCRYSREIFNTEIL